MRFNRTFLVIFAILDAVLLGRHLSHIPLGLVFAEQPWMFQVLAVLRSVFLISLAFSAFGLAGQRKWGLVFSYVQFPVRFVFMYLSFGFLTLVPAFISGPYGELPVLIVAMTLECTRLVLTIFIHRRRAKHEAV